MRPLLIILASASLWAQGSLQYQTTRRTETGAAVRSAQDKLNETVSVKDFGAKGDGSTDDTASIANAIAAADGKALYFPAGIYSIDNSSGSFSSTGISGTWYGDGDSTVLKCTDLGNICVQFFSAHDLTVRNLAVTFGPTKTTRCSGGANTTNLEFTSASNLTLENLALYNGNCQGIGMTIGDHIRARNIRTWDLLANGTQWANVVDLQADGISGTNNGDATFEVDKYDGVGSHACSNITASNITGSGGNSGILIDSCQNVSISNFSLDLGTGASYIGIGVVLENAVSPTTTPDNITISNGYVKGGGNSNGCILISNIDVVSPPANEWSVTLNNIKAEGCAGDGIDIGDDGKTYSNVTLNNVSINGTGLGGSVGLGKGIRLGGRRITGSNITIASAAAQSLWLSSALHVDLSNVRSINPNQAAVSSNAVETSVYASPLYVMVNGLILEDSGSVSASNITDGVASSTRKSFINVDHSRVTGTGWTASTVNTYNTIVREASANYWAMDTANAQAFLPPGWNQRFDNNSSIFWKGSDGVVRQIIYVDGADISKFQVGKSGGSIGMYSSSANPLIGCTDAGSCRIPGLGGGGVLGVCTDNNGVLSSCSPALPNVGTPGTYTKVTTDAQGRVSSGTTLAASDLPVLGKASVSLTGQTASIGATNIQIGGSVIPAGLYRVHIYASVPTPGSGNITITLGWNDGVGAKTNTAVTLSLVSGAYGISSIPILADGSTNLTYTVTYVSTGTYNLRITLEKLS